APRNAAVESSSAGLQNGANPLAIIGGLIELIVPPRKNKPAPEPYIGRIELEKIVREKYGDAFFAEVLKIEKKDISNFFDFCEESGFPRNLLKKEKEMDLLEYLLEKSELFREA
ncbi:hypothetical protein, partial [Longispora fulva]